METPMVFRYGKSTPPPGSQKNGQSHVAGLHNYIMVNRTTDKYCIFLKQSKAENPPGSAASGSGLSKPTFWVEMFKYL